MEKPDTRTEEESDAVQRELAQQDKYKANLLLEHVCGCDDEACGAPEFADMCPRMKRFLRAVCWGSHSAQWCALPVATATSELLAFHAINCQTSRCFVPLCEQLRGHVIG